MLFIGILSFVLHDYAKLSSQFVLLSVFIIVPFTLDSPFVTQYKLGKCTIFITHVNYLDNNDSIIF